MVSTTRQRQRLMVEGVVQGVGFRPFVYGLATRLGLAGIVGNDSAGAFIEIEGAPAQLARFGQALLTHPPPLAHIERVTTTCLPCTAATAFTIVESEPRRAARTLISPDLALCDDCLRELFDPTNRRYRYPFINCTNCGPRFTIMRDLPYDRPLTTMAGFPLCPDCQREYTDPLDRRFHAQPIACPHCGPQVEFCLSPATRCAVQQRAVGEAALQAAQALLTRGGIVAVKGIGGFHLACDATNDQVIQTLRARKGRVDKPFALMARDVATVRTVAEVDEAELALLTSRARPIVLLKKRASSRLSNWIAPGNGYVGVMLPYSPLHHLLLAENGAPDGAPVLPLLVMTSGNQADEPIAQENEEALARLAGLADAFLLHNRPIQVQCDDSVLRVWAGHEYPIRRSRGYAPFPVKLPFALPPVLAVGGELKSTFCLAQGEHAFLSQHIGDMQNLETLRAFARSVQHLQTILHIAPQLIACDLHPGYLSTRWAEEHSSPLPLVKVQHHHAHLAALMAEHGLDGHTPVIGFSFDGTGYGPDGAIWGGEVLLADYRHYRRVAHLKYFPLPGGDAAIRRPYRTALAALWAAGLVWERTLPPVVSSTATELGVLQRQLEVGLNCVATSSMGRLFDAVAALAGVCQTATYEAQAAIELETRIDQQARGSYDFVLPTPQEPWFDAVPVLQAVIQDYLAGVGPGVIAARFHTAVADLVLALSLWVRSVEEPHPVALSGGVFQNTALLAKCVRRLQSAGFTVLTHRYVPPNDGGIALGQAVIAAQQMNGN
jgi:hydrogenase maturation protein HypF